MKSSLKISLLTILPSVCSAAPTANFNFAAFFDTFSPLYGWPPAGWPSPTSIPTATGTDKIALQPTAGTSWNIQLISVPKPSQADDDAYSVWDFDLFDAPVSTIEAFHAKGHKVICYFSAGSWENWRPDASDFPKDALGKALDGWPGEKWLDVRGAGVRNIMKQRIQMAKQKGCDGVDPDVSQTSEVQAITTRTDTYRNRTSMATRTTLAFLSRKPTASTTSSSWPRPLTTPAWAAA